MKNVPHGWLGDSPLGRGSHARSLCKKAEIWDSVAIPLGTSDAPVGQTTIFPDWVCKDCRSVAAKLPKKPGRKYAYAVIEAKDHKRFLDSMNGSLPRV